MLPQPKPQRASMLSDELDAKFETLGLVSPFVPDGELIVRSPNTGRPLGALAVAANSDLHNAVARAQEAFKSWRAVPAPLRGDLVRVFGSKVRKHKSLIASIITLECGKTVEEAEGEIQEVIDICDFAVGLSRQLYGLTIATERPDHRMSETWHPVGVFGQITAFNFPAAVWSWGAMIALVCGNSVVWKPSEKAPLTALSLQAVMASAIKECGAPAFLSQVIIGDQKIGRSIALHQDVPIVSATGSVEMGKSVAITVASRLGRSILELGGNNATIVTPEADMDLSIRGVTFAAVGTAGQRCTSLRRLIIHRSIADEFVAKLKDAYGQLRIDDPSIQGVHLGPLIDECAYINMQKALEVARNDGGAVWGGERVHAERNPDAFYVRPAIVEMPAQTEIVKQETFAPIMYVMQYDTLDQAIELQNGVTQGLSSSIFTNNMREAEYFISAAGSDCGIANVNIGTSGAEIGGAFGGEKMTGGGRAAGSDTWKNFMRRATNTINYSPNLPLAQGIEFDL